VIGKCVFCKRERELPHTVQMWTSKGEPVQVRFCAECKRTAEDMVWQNNQPLA
jgi:uncharacterized protein YlaI